MTQFSKAALGFVAMLPLIYLLSYFRHSVHGSNFWSHVPVQDMVAFAFCVVTSSWAASFTIGSFAISSLQRRGSLEKASKGLVYNSQKNRLEITSPRFTEYSWHSIWHYIETRPLTFAITAYLELFVLWTIYLGLTAEFGLVMN